MTLTLRLSEDTYHAAYAVFAYWWAPPDSTRDPLSGHDVGALGRGEFVGVLPPPPLYAERLALTLRTGL